MRQLYSEGAFAPIPVKDGFVFIAQQPEPEPELPAEENGADEEVKEVRAPKMTVGYKMYNFDDDTVTHVTRSVYQLSKFGINYERFSADYKKYLPCKIVALNPKQQLIIEPNGDARIVNSSDKISWIGVMRFNDEPPCCVHYSGGILWATFNEAGAVVKYNTQSMLDELRIGGGKLKSFEKPEGIWAEGSQVLICTGEKIVRLDLVSFDIEDYRNFGEPVHTYFRVGDNEVVQLESGFYAL